MFKNIFMYELEKFWTKKINLICFASILIISIVSLKFGLDNNSSAQLTDPIFSSNMNFQITSLQESIITMFNIIIIIFFTLSFNEEYRKGTLKMAFLRPISIRKLYVAKVLVLMLNVLLLLVIQIMFSLILGNIFLPHVNETGLFLKEGTYAVKDTIIYTLKYYFMGYMTLIAFGSIIQFLSIKCKAITVAIGLSIATIFANFIYIAAILAILRDANEFGYLSISTIYAQFSGMAYFAAGVTNSFVIGMTILIVIFQVLAYFSFIKEDYLE